MLVARYPELFPCGTCQCDPSRGYDAGYERWEIPGVGKFSKCLKQKVTAYARQSLELHRFLRAGHLYQSGGVMDQPASYLAAMDCVERVILSLEPKDG